MNVGSQLFAKYSDCLGEESLPDGRNVKSPLGVERVVHSAVHCRWWLERLFSCSHNYLLGLEAGNCAAPALNTEKAG